MADEQIGAFGVAGSGTTLVIPIASGKTAVAGDMVIVVVATNAVSPETATAQDDNGNAYTVEIPQTSQGSGLRGCVFRRDIVGGSDELEDSSNNNITVTFSVTCNRKDAVIVKVQGVSPGVPHKQRSEGGVSTAPLATTTAALTVACKVLGCCAAAAPASQPTLGFTPGSGYTELADHALNGTTNRGCAVEIKNQGAGAVATADGTITSGAWLMFTLAYALAASGTPYTITPGGSIGPTGELGKTVSKMLGGAISPAGQLGKNITRAIGGTITPAGALLKATTKSLAGAINPTGLIAKMYGKRFGPGGTNQVIPSGALRKAIGKNLTGTVAPAGVLTTFGPGKNISAAGTITPAGSLSRAVSKALAGTILPAGTVRKAISRLFGGAISPGGGVAMQKSSVGEVFPRFTFIGDGDQAIRFTGDGGQRIDFQGDGS